MGSFWVDIRIDALLGANLEHHIARLFTKIKAGVAVDLYGRAVKLELTAHSVRYLPRPALHAAFTETNKNVIHT